MKQEEEIDICINLINWIENFSISNDEIISKIFSLDYLKKAEILDNQRVDKKKSLPLIGIIENILSVLKNADKDLPIHNQRYRCSYLDIESRLIQSCKNLELTNKELVNYLSKAEYIILQSHFTEFVIEKILIEDNVIKAIELISFISEKDYHYSSYRLIANYYGLKGDKENFIKILKKCDARKDVYDLEFIKEKFIEVYSKNNDLKETFEIIKRKEFGSKYLVSALQPIIENQNFKEVKSIVENEIFKTSNLYLKEIILTNSFSFNLKNQTKENFVEIQNLLNEIPSKVRYGNSDFSLNDNLWSLIVESLIKNNKQTFKNEIEYGIKRIKSKMLKDNQKKQLIK